MPSLRELQTVSSSSGNLLQNADFRETIFAQMYMLLFKELDVFTPDTLAKKFLSKGLSLMATAENIADTIWLPSLNCGYNRHIVTFVLKQLTNMCQDPKHEIYGFTREQVLVRFINCAHIPKTLIPGYLPKLEDSK